MILKLTILALVFMAGRLSKRVNLANNRKYRNILIYLGNLINKGATSRSCRASLVIDRKIGEVFRNLL